MRLPSVHARLSGMVRFEILDEHGRPSYATDQHGRRVRGGYWSPNLITDTGLDELATYTFQNATSSGWRGYLGVGTGSTAPDVADSTLDAEVQRTSDTGGFAASTAFSVDTVTDELVAEYTLTRVVTMTADRNLTEYGFTPTNNTALYVIRELFRDEFGDPVTLTILNGKKLRLDHKLTIRLPYEAEAKLFEIEEFDALDNLVDTIQIDTLATFFATTSALYERPVNVWNPATNPNAITKGRFYANTVGGDPAPNVGITHITSPEVYRAWEAYTAGSHEREAFWTFTEAQLATTWGGFNISGASGLTANQSNAGYKVVFDDPSSFTKLNTHTFRVGYRVTWARA